MATYSVNYDDKRFKAVETEKNNTLNSVNNFYNNAINQSDAYFNKQIDAVKDYQNTQQDIQNQKTEQAINEINQQKEWQQKDYEKEQQGSYVDYMKATNQYGANAEQRATQGLSDASGMAESNKVAAWSAYQARYASARETNAKAIQNYDNQITNARLQNSSILAEIAFNSLKEQLSLGLQGFQYKNTLLSEQLQQQQSINNQYYQRYQDVLSQINQENQFKYQQERDKVADSQWQKEYNLSKKTVASRSSSGGGSSSSVSFSDGGNASQLAGTTAKNGVSIMANPFTGTINPDAANGVFKDSSGKGGYQPNNVDGNALSKFAKVTGTDIFGSKSPYASKSVWKATSGKTTKYYVWDGKQNSYIDISNNVRSWIDTNDK